MTLEAGHNNSNHFLFDNLDTVELAKKFGTPLYVVSEEEIKNKCQAIREEFLMKYINTWAAYASKAFLTMAMCKIIEREGLGLDVVSGGELYTAIQADFPMEKVIFHGNNKSYEELELAVTNDVGRIIVDNFLELEMLEKIAQAHKKQVYILFRITPEVEGKTHQYITTGQKDSKFGIPLQEEIIEKAVIQAIESSYINLIGFHFHVGSQLFEKESYIKAAETAIKLMEDLNIKFGFTTQELNIGGGFGINYTDEETRPLSHYVDPIMVAIKRLCKKSNIDLPTIIIEPGRWIIGEAGITLYTLGAIKEIPEIRTYVSVDGGLPDNPRPALYNAKYRAVVANKVKDAADQLVTIAGKCCETGDILIWDLLVPRIVPGDILAVVNTGAYNFSMASNYNRLPKPAVVLISNGEPHLIVERETYQDLLDKELIPSHLNKTK